MCRACRGSGGLGGTRRGQEPLGDLDRVQRRTLPDLVAADEERRAARARHALIHADPPDEHIVAGGDTGAKIARAKGVSLADLQAVNPGVDWAKLKVGQKIKLPKK